MCLYIVRAPPPGADWLIRRLTSACMRTRKACALSKPRCRLLRLRPSDLTAPAAGRAPFGPAPARALLTRFCTFVCFKVPHVSDAVRCLSVSVQLVSRGVTPRALPRCCKRQDCLPSPARVPCRGGLWLPAAPWASGTRDGRPSAARLSPCGPVPAAAARGFSCGVSASHSCLRRPCRPASQRYCRLQGARLPCAAVGNREGDVPSLLLHSIQHTLSH